MNAGCFNREFKDILISIQEVTKSGQIITIPAKDINFKLEIHPMTLFF